MLHEIHSSLTLNVVRVTNDLHWSVKDPRHCGSKTNPRPDSERHVGWELENVISIPLSHITRLSEDRAISNALEDLTELLVTDALCSIRKFVCRMDWKSPHRKPEEEVQYYTKVLNDLSLIYSKMRPRDPNPLRNAVKSLLATWKIGMCQPHIVGDSTPVGSH